MIHRLRRKSEPSDRTTKRYANDSDRKSTRLNSSHTVISYAVTIYLYSFPTRRSSDLFDHEVKLDRWDWVEVAGFAYRTDFDLRSHMQATGIDLRVFKAYDSPIEKKVRTIRPNHEKIRQRFGADAGRIISLLAKEDLPRILQGKRPGDSIKIDANDIPVDFFDTKEETVKEAGAKFLPHVVEPSFGVERLVYSTLEHNLRMKGERLILSLPIGIAPTQAVVYPLVNRNGLVEKAQRVHRSQLHGGLRVE